MDRRPADSFLPEPEATPAARPLLSLMLLLALPLWMALGGPIFALPGQEQAAEQSTATVPPISATPGGPVATADPVGCASQTPSPTPSPSPTSYRVFDARADLAASAARVRRREIVTVMARGYSPFAYRLSSYGVQGLRFTGVFTYSHPALSPSNNCSLDALGFVCHDDSLRSNGPIHIYAEAVALAPVGGRARICAEVDTSAPFGSGHDSNPANDSDCLDIEILPEIEGLAGAPAIRSQGSDRRGSLRTGLPRLAVPIHPPSWRRAQSSATPTDRPSLTPTDLPSPTPTPTATNTPGGPLPVCASPTATASPSATPTSVRVFDASVETWSSVPAAWPGDALRLVVEAKLDLKWRIEGEIEGAEGLRFTGVYTFSRAAGPPPRRCEIEDRAFRCWLDLPEAYISGDEELYLDAVLAADAQTGTAKVCARVSIEAPFGSGGDPVTANNQRCVNVKIVPPEAPRPTPPGRTPGTGETPPTPAETATPDGPNETPSATAPNRRLWLPALRRTG